ncbi:hypothetical protein A0H81_09712 [Grifola frondosa]|uniref:Uncharacterized protein n=1 Tax=Grifola frondosa TaxID=5627 RepID=A0A1C7LZY4_GRIFR|nr:hypothetical protein A0H81_09712 [Grifola frondosa]
MLSRDDDRHTAEYALTLASACWLTCNPDYDFAPSKTPQGRLHRSHDSDAASPILTVAELSLCSLPADTHVEARVSEIMSPGRTASCYLFSSSSPDSKANSTSFRWQ